MTLISWVRPSGRPGLGFPALAAVFAAVIAGALPAGAATVQGSVVDELGASPPGAVVVAVEAGDWGSLGDVQTFDGSYSLEVPDGSDVLLIAVCFSGQRLSGYDLHGYTLGVERVGVVEGTVGRDIGVRRCHEVILEGLDPDGSRIQHDDVNDGAFVVDGDGEASLAGLLGVDNPSTGDQAPALCIPVGESQRLYLRRLLEGAGQLTVPLDREGAPFEAPSQGAEIVDLNEALARTQLARLDQLLEETTATGAVVPPGLQDRIADAEESLDDAVGMAGADRASALDRTSAAAIVALEDLLLWRAAGAAGTVRTGTLKVTVLDPVGRPVQGATLCYRQRSHDFGFGIFEPLAVAGDAVYARMREAGLDFNTSGFYWGDISPSEGEIDWDSIDHHIGVRELAPRGWRIKGHPLTWLLALAMPDYLRSMDYEELLAASIEHVDTLVRAYRDVVRIWDVNNEASGYPASGGLSRDQMDAYLLAVYSTARRADPGATLVLNNLFDRFGTARFGERIEGRAEVFTLSVPAFVQRCIDRGVDFDVVGQQLYNGGAVTLFADWGLGAPGGVPTFDLGYIHDFLEELAALGKPIHITEHAVPSVWDEVSESVHAGFWRRRWDEPAQADYVEALYTIAFGMADVHAVTWWNAIDGQPFIAHGGLFHEDGTPKQALLRLEALIDGWTTSGEATTDASGRAVIHGFAGSYEITAEAGGPSVDIEAAIAERGDRSVTVVLPPGPREPLRSPGRTR